MPIIRDMARELAANVAMSVAPVRNWRINRPRAGARFSPGLLERYAFQALRGLERHGVQVEGRSVAEFGPGDTLAAGLALLDDFRTRTWWREDALEPLTALRDRLDEVLAVDWYDGLGFGFRAGTALAAVFNAGDELGLSDAPDSPYVQLTPI